MKFDPFFQVPQFKQHTSEGDVALPILYFDASALYAFFLVEKSRSEAQLAGTGLVPDLCIGKYTIAGFACYEYRDTTVGVYNEVGLALAACPKGEEKEFGSWWEFLRTFTVPEERCTGMHVLHLPVTTAAANAAGREIWGFPKFVTPIEFKKEGRSFRCAVRDPGSLNQIATLEGEMGFGVPMRPLSLALYSNLNSKVVRCTVNARGKSYLHSGGSLKLSLNGGSHPMAATIAALGLEDAKPIAVLSSAAFQSRLNAGVSLQAVG